MTPKQVYVAGRFEYRSACREVMDSLEDAGHTISYDWTVHTAGREGREQRAQEDWDGIGRCDVFLLLISTHPGRGAHVELGMAYALGKEVLVVGKGSPSIFYFLSGVRRLASVEETLQYLNKERTPS